MSLLALYNKISNRKWTRWKPSLNKYGFSSFVKEDKENFELSLAWLEIKKILRSPFGDKLEKFFFIVAKCKFLVASLYNVNDTPHSKVWCDP